MTKHLWKESASLCLQSIHVSFNKHKIPDSCNKNRATQNCYKRGGGAESVHVFSAFPQIEATLLRSAECKEVQRVAECCWHLAWLTSEPRRHLWQGHCRKHKWELMAPLFRVIRYAFHHTILGRHYWAQLTSCTHAYTKEPSSVKKARWK